MPNRKLEDLVHYLKDAGFLKSERVEEAFLKVDRELFIPEDWKRHSFPYADIAIPIVEDVTISAPSVIARTFELAELKEGEKVLEIGTGSGYTTAIASYLVGEEGKVVSVEINEKAFRYARERLEKARKKFSLPNNFELHNADGKEFFYAEKFFDAVIVHAAFSKVEENWEQQLKEEGRIVGPMEELGLQWLVRIHNGKVEKDIPVVYVRLR